ncbi:MAG TPA: dual specificity protein phosphatase family protein [Vicinamibacterales bacterium]|nr:dual specificity protein phosphatase family protein [Vicinamibacterales bacterium]
MDLYQIDDDRRLFISPALDCWDAAAEHGIDVVIDLDGGLDACIPTDAGHCLYIYFHIIDDNEQLPPLAKLRAIARLGATLITGGHRVLSHCGLGFNRSALVAGMILVELGMTGAMALARIRERRPGALYNEGFAAFLEAQNVALAV